MAEKVSSLGITRDPGFLYFLRGSDVYKTKMKQLGGAAGMLAVVDEPPTVTV